MSKEFRLYTRGLILNSYQEVLLIKKNSNQKYAGGKWIFPGGTCEWGENAEETLSRELLEEINAKVVALQLLGTRTIVLEEIHWQGIYYKTEISNIQELKNCEPEKHSEIKWFSFEHLPTDMDEIDRKHLKMLIC